MNIVIIEDEELTAEDLCETITSFSKEYHVVKVLHSVKEGIEYFKKADQPDLIFSDIDLGDGLSFEIFKKLETTVPVIFCTAFNEYALQAFRANGIDYILKPYDKKSVSKAIEKFKALKKPPSNNYGELLEALSSKLNPSAQTLLTYSGDKIIPVKITDVSLAYSEKEKSYIMHNNGKISQVNYTLEELESVFGKEFYRANRQVIISKNAIKEVVQHFGRKLLIKLNVNFNMQVFVSKAKATDFLNWLRN
jgi:DNA-binding LytR/AlgR family response regulator